MAASLRYFDTIAPEYDRLWTRSNIGRLQRDAVWREIGCLVQSGDRVLDLGCGTGEDALRLMRLGAQVCAIDASAEMVRIAASKGVDARHLPIEHLVQLPGQFDFVLSNFGALNCISDLAALGQELGRLVRSGGILAVCIMNRFCVWEAAFYAAKGNLRKATRRWTGTSHADGIAVFYPSRSAICTAWKPSFRLRADIGIGIFVPPSSVSTFPSKLLKLLDQIDARVNKIFHSLGDHRLLLFSRSRS